MMNVTKGPCLVALSRGGVEGCGGSGQHYIKGTQTLPCFCVVAGRLPLPPPQQIDETHAVFQLDAADQINHIVVFMTGEQPFPEGYGATVHLMWPKDPGSQAPSQWQLLGCLQNTKPSAIFRIRDPKREAAAVPGMTRTATLGISIEALADVERQMQSLTGNAPPATSTPNQASQSLALAAKTSPDSLLQQASALAAPIGT